MYEYIGSHAKIHSGLVGCAPNLFIYALIINHHWVNSNKQLASE